MPVGFGNQTRRYTVSREDEYVVLRVQTKCALGKVGDVRRFWAPINGGHVREMIDGTPSGYRTCGRKLKPGSDLHASRASLLSVVRQEARRALR